MCVRKSVDLIDDKRRKNTDRRGISPQLNKPKTNDEQGLHQPMREKIQRGEHRTAAGQFLRSNTQVRKMTSCLSRASSCWQSTCSHAFKVLTLNHSSTPPRASRMPSIPLIVIPARKESCIRRCLKFFVSIHSSVPYLTKNSQTCPN